MARLDVSNPLIWIDCEMTGLDPDKEEIIEIFCIITNGNLEVIDQEGWRGVIHQSKERMDEMDEWCTTTHDQTGLTADVIASKTTPEQASNGLLEYIKRFAPDRGRGVLAGNTVHCDKAFLRKQPYTQVIDHLHYRIFDVSSLKIAAGLWSAEEVRKGVPVKKNYHKAKEDILESIAEARYYKEAIYQRAKDV